MTYLGELLKAARIKKQLSIKDVAERFGVKPITIYKIESGTNFPSVEILAQYYFLMKIDLKTAMTLIQKEIQ